MAGSPPPCSMDLSGWLLWAPRSASTPQKWRLGVLVLLQILCFQTARSQVSVHVVGEVMARLGSDVELNCSVETMEQISQLTWQKKMSPNNENLLTYREGRDTTYLTPFAMERIRFVGGGKVGNIVIQNMTSGDEGTYICSYSTHPTGTKEQEIDLQILVPPEFYLIPSRVRAVVGDSPKVMARCFAAARPGAYITWDTGRFDHTGSGTVVQHENLTVTTSSDLLMKPQRELYNSKVTCVVTHEKIQYNTTFFISNVEFAPYDVHIEKVQRDDGLLEIYCGLTANPYPHTFNWTWVKGNKTYPMYIPSNYKRVTVPKNTSDGYYVCEVENLYGRASGQFYVAPECPHPYWYVTLIFLIPSLILNACLLYHCLKSRRPTESPGKDVL
uniref:Ig-like domain-containing protein n=1 Tax=Leptobrachium leishanense TaxID=445787 RepID=A0A8C5LSX7_9ANUR